MRPPARQNVGPDRGTWNPCVWEYACWNILPDQVLGTRNGSSKRPLQVQPMRGDVRPVMAGSRVVVRAVAPGRSRHGGCSKPRARASCRIRIYISNDPETQELRMSGDPPPLSRLVAPEIGTLSGDDLPE